MGIDVPFPLAVLAGSCHGGRVTTTVLDFERCYRAVSTRDSRFDGQFYTAVRTTGIYCRPSCPAITPKRTNVTFLPTAAAAQQAGYRACRRCLPDASPGSPQWNTRADLAARAMRLIRDGVVERGGVPALATHLGYSQRQLTRVLTNQLGAGPLALARAHRAHTARLLIQTTTMPMSDIAFAAGFASIRQFNDTVREVFAVSPTTMRSEVKKSPNHLVQGSAGTLAVRLPFRQPLDRRWLEWFLSAYAVPGLELWENRTFLRNVRTPHGHAGVRLNFRDGHVHAELALRDMRDLAPTIARIRHLLDLDADPVGIDNALGVHIRTGRPHFTPGIRVPGCLDGPELLLRTLIGQHLSRSAAATQLSRLVTSLGESTDGAIGHVFPTPQAIAEHGAEVLSGPPPRVRAVLSAAQALATGSLVLHPGRTAVDLRRDLAGLEGMGPQAADWVTMRVLADPDVLLATDPLVRRGAARCGITVTNTARWAPWRSYLSMQLWQAGVAALPAPMPAKVRP